MFTLSLALVELMTRPYLPDVSSNWVPLSRGEDDLVQKFLIEDYLSTYQNERRIKLAARDRKPFLLTTWLLLISDDLCVFRRRGFWGVCDKLDII